MLSLPDHHVLANERGLPVLVAVFQHASLVENHQNWLPAVKSMASGLAVQSVQEKNVCFFLQHAQCADHTDLVA